MTEQVDTVVIGAGVVGLAVTRALALAGREVLVLEAAGSIGTEISSRNSEVIHAGIYYPAGSLKARLCVAGRDKLYAYCASHGVPHKRLGKLIVATSDTETALLANIRRKAEANGVTDLVSLTSEEAIRLEPALFCTAALLSPSTGIIDSHSLMLAYQGDAENVGAVFAFHAPVVGGQVLDNGIRLEVDGDDPMSLDARLVVNATGLGAVGLAKRIGVPVDRLPGAWLCKGSYYALQGHAPFRHLIYPTPEHAGLGVHLTLDLGGQARFGPDVEWTDHIDYDVELKRADGFYGAIRRYWPDLADGALAPAYSGMRPKISGPSDPAADFRIDGPAEHGIPGLINLLGIESPGLTASLAIAEMVAEVARANMALRHRAA
jgi:L-2-hydroxyglutarate oxidase LhgO